MAGERTDRTVGALLRVVAQFNSIHDRIKIKLGLPAEIFPEIQRASANPLKDFINFDQVRWTSVELAQIAAYRYRLFLQIHDPEFYSRITDIDLNHRDGARKFWNKIFPDPLKNRYGGTESAMTFMLRHTQLVPRQLFRILHRVIRASHASTGGYRSLKPNCVHDAIVEMEEIVAGEIFVAFRHVYPRCESLCKAVFSNFQTVFNYDELETKWRRSGRPIMRDDPSFELIHFVEMLSRMGIIGLFEKETDRYVEAKFSYQMLMPFPAGERMIFAMHPVFSRCFGCSVNSQKKAILPQGASLERPARNDPDVAAS
jgi:hypothetical protein